MTAAACAERVGELQRERQELRAAGADPVVLESNRRDLGQALRAWGEWLIHEHTDRTPVQP